MSLGKRFRLAHLPPEDREHWLALLRGDYMEPIYFSPRYPEATAWFWVLLAGGLAGLVGLFRHRLGDIWLPAANAWWYGAFVVLATISWLGLLLALRRRKLARILTPTPGRYLFPVGYLDTSEALWEFISLQDMETATLEDIRKPISQLPGFMCQIQLKDQSTLGFVMPTMEESEELTDVMLLLLRAEEEVAAGLNERIAEFATLADVAATMQSAEPQPSDALWRQLGPLLRYPAWVALVMGCVIGSLVFQVRDRWHIYQQIEHVRKSRDVEAMRMIAHWVPYPGLRHSLYEMIHQEYAQQLRSFAQKSAKRGALTRWFRELFETLEARLDSVVAMEVRYLPTKSDNPKTRKVLDQLFGGALGQRLGWSLSAHIREGFLQVFDESILRLERRDATSAFHYYFMVGQEKASRLAYRYRERIRSTLKQRGGWRIRPSKSVRPTLTVTFQPWTTGEHYQIQTLRRTKAGGRHQAISKDVYPALSFRVVLTFHNQEGKVRPLRLATQLAPARWLGFYEGGKASRGQQMLLSGVAAKGAPRIYASMAASAWHRYKKALPALLQGKEGPYYRVPLFQSLKRPVVARRAPASMPSEIAPVPSPRPGQAKREPRLPSVRGTSRPVQRPGKRLQAPARQPVTKPAQRVADPKHPVNQ